MRRIYIVFLAVFGSLTSLAQNEVDALRYSYQEPVGSARFTAMGGAFGALGAEFSAISINPAGLALFRRSEISFSLGLNEHQTQTRFGSNVNRSNQSQWNLNIPQIGIVASNDTRDPGWSRVNFAVGYNRLRNFNEQFTSSGYQNNNSLLELFAVQSNGLLGEEITEVLPFGAGLAWDTFLINPLDSLTEDQFTSVNPYGRFGARKQVERSGHMGETVVSVGGAYQDRLFIGGSLGFPRINFREKSTYTESDLVVEHELESFTYTEELKSTGRGVNIKLGAIYKLTQHLRVGAAWHSPSYLSMTDSYDTEITARYKDGDELSSMSPNGSFTYSIRTPSRLLANAAYVLGKSGLVSADYEYVNYKKARLNSANGPGEEYDFARENDAVKTIYRATHNVRAGFEWRVAKPFSLRCGMAYQQTAFDPALADANSNRVTYSFGAGFRRKGGYIDVAYQRALWDSEYYHYDPSIVAASSVQHMQGQAVVSVGFRY